MQKIGDIIHEPIRKFTVTDEPWQPEISRKVQQEFETFLQLERSKKQNIPANGRSIVTSGQDVVENVLLKSVLESPDGIERTL